MKTHIKILTMLSAVALAITARADTVIGSWQGTSDEGWIRVNGGGASQGSIFDPANDPLLIAQDTNVVAGYFKTLDLHETGFGNVRIQLNLTAIPGGLAAFTNNSKMQFTFSCPPATNGGFMQLVQLQYNSSTSGFQQISSGWAAAGFSETGSTNNDSGGQPIFFFFNGSAARSQVVTWDYSSIKASIGNSPSYLQFTFVFQTGGGAPTNVFLNNILLTGAGTPSIIVDQFNPTNNPYTGAFQYNAGQITNVWGTNWFGGAITNLIWDPTTDADGNPNSGSMKITATFNGANQWVIHDKGPSFSFAGINPPITNGIGLLTFEFDVKYDPSSPKWIVGGGTNFGHLEWGVVPPFSPAVSGSINVDVTNTGWTHVVIPLNGGTDPNLLSISGIFFKQDGQSYGALVGTSTLWLDNLKFTYTNITFVPPPVLSIEKASPAMRLFGASSGVFDRSELATANQNQTWVGGSYPVTYSFKLLSYSTLINQTHIFLIPTNSTIGTGPYGYNGVDFTASNGLWMTLTPFGNGAVANVLWKTNQAGANPANTALRFTNSIAVGTWTLTFNSATTGSVTGPGSSPVAFSLPPDMAAQFNTNVVAYFGMQPNSANGQGIPEDWGSISITGTPGGNISEDFTTESTPDVSAAWVKMTTAAKELVVVSPTQLPAWWVHWTTPALNFGLGTAVSVFGNSNTSDPWMLPEYYNNYNDGNDFPTTAQRGAAFWVLIPSVGLPTTDGNPGGPISPTAYFRLFNPPLLN